METAYAATTRAGNEPLSPEAFDRVRAAQVSWAGKTVRERLRWIRRLRQLLPDMMVDFCDAVSSDIHKPQVETIATELLPVAGACRFLEKRAARILRSRKVRWWDTPIWLFGERDRVVRKPRGIVGIIGTWNYPYFLNAVQIVHALTAGNAVVWKPSEMAPKSAQAISRWLAAGQTPTDLVTILPAAREWGPKLVEAEVDHIVFTGHDATGRKMASRLGERLISSTLELSGHDAVLLLEDADLNLTAKAVHFGTTVNAGQTCVAARRVFVPRKIYGQFLDILKQQFSLTASTRPLAQPNQADHIDRLVKDALVDGAKLLLYPVAISLENRGFLPIVVVDVRPEMKICSEAVFAPVVAILPFDETREAIEAIQRNDYGLGLSIFTAKIREAQRMAVELPAGLVTINDIVGPVAHPATPFGGVRRSGWGVTQGIEGLLEMTIPQVISHRTGQWRPHFDPPGTTVVTDHEVLAAMLRWQNGRSFWQRVKSFFSMANAAKEAMKKSKS